ncbi:hypothetical protein NPIL_56191 [Nephila pilipes]|uniref:Uncharacterized protein n=1 Tax=Nephila pilipes TaxID=299642 RepID=A0A8X6NZ38_NEPPI|nr:hypothetical protein NPIL_56191 [Nephila pilipes]
MVHLTDEEEGEEGALPEEVPLLPQHRAHGQLTQDEKKFLLSVERGDVATVRRIEDLPEFSDCIQEKYY